MLTKLTSDKISKFWPNIADAIRASVVPLARYSDEGMTHLLEMLLVDSMQVWALSEEEEGRQRIYAICVTHIYVDPGTLTKSLLIYALYGYSSIPEELWKDGLRSLRLYAASQDCAFISGFTTLDRIRQVVTSLGGSADTTYILLEV